MVYKLSITEMGNIKPQSNNKYVEENPIGVKIDCARCTWKRGTSTYACIPHPCCSKGNNTTSLIEVWEGEGVIYNMGEDDTF